jgi:hypothetical protein
MPRKDLEGGCAHAIQDFARASQVNPQLAMPAGACAGK